MIKIYKNDNLTVDEIMSRNTTSDGVEQTVAEIISEVRKNGDEALRKYTLQFDGAIINDFMVAEREFDDAFENVEDKFIEILEEAADNITKFHRHQVRNNFIISEKEGVTLGQKVTPIERVGLYVPGGTACYPSTVLMDCIPAKIAGCKEIIMTTPAKNGVINPAILVAAKIAGVDKIYKLGGAQAIAALAYGTKAIQKVDKIVGPGNVFVAEAKKQVYGAVDIDMIAGPSEILIIADGTCNPKYVAADMLSQAEHDKNATAVLVTDSETLADKVSAELEKQIPQLPRADIARASIDNNGKIIIKQSIDEAINVANEIAPEHLEICLDNPFDYLPKIKNAGSIFLGKNCPEALGDYFAGPNHTLPTGGTARFSSPLSVDDFVKKSSFICYSKDALEKVYKKVDYFAQKEGLQAHGKSVTVRFDKE